VHRLPPKDTKREGVQLEGLEVKAKKLTLNPSLITKIYQLIVVEVVKEHNKRTSV